MAITESSAPGPRSRHVLQHAALGEMHGLLRSEDVVQFRGIPFADIPGRFRQAVLRSALPQTPFDATKPGPTCPQLTSQEFPSFWEGPLAHDGVVLDKPVADEFACLNLSITAPKSVLETAADKIPVLVFIHGGGFTVGCSSLQVAGREVYDGLRLVQRSVSLGHPVVVVSINYRLGPLGFLASRELESMNKSFGEAVGNYGLHDQRQALDWIDLFIGGFGGDRERVTIQGGSAGGTSCHFQAQFPTTKIKRAILSSGTTLALGAMPLDYHQDRFDAFVRKHASADDMTEPVQALQSIPVEELVNQPITTFYYPLIDGEWIKGRTATALREVSTSVDLMVGSCAFEQDLTLAMMGAMDPAGPREDAALRALMTEMLQPAGLTTNVGDFFSPAILEAYGVADTLETPSKSLEAWAEFLADIIFRIPPYLVALKNTTSKTFVYDFQALNPFPGWKLGYGKSNHAISDIFLYNAAEDLVAEPHQAEYAGAVGRLQEDWIRFCHGKLDWEPFEVNTPEKLGPVYTLANHGESAKYESVAAALGEEVARRWKAVLEVAET